MTEITKQDNCSALISNFTNYATQIVKLPLIHGASATPNGFIVRVHPNNLRVVSALVGLSTHIRSNSLVDIAVTDKLSERGRFAVKYLFLSTLYNARIVVEIYTTETSPIPSIAGAFFNNKAIFASAGWLEREVWDLFGIFAQGNPDLRRILTDYGFSGHPFRKDFPLTGFTELFYNDSEGRVVAEPVELAQEFRVFHL